MPKRFWNPVEDCCFNCIYYLKRERECHREPPKVVRNEVDNIVTRWPLVGGKDWCGEHKRKAETHGEAG